MRIIGKRHLFHVAQVLTPCGHRHMAPSNHASTEERISFWESYHWYALRNVVVAEKAADCNFIAGPIPPSFNRRRIRDFDLSNNLLSGPMAAFNFTGMIDLLGVNLQNNPFESGPFPDTLCTLVDLDRIRNFEFANTSLVGTACTPCLVVFSCLCSLCAGPIPECLARAWSTNVGYNRLSGMCDILFCI